MGNEENVSTTTNLNELDPDSPEYEAALEAAQRAEDEATGNAERAPGTDDDTEGNDGATDGEGSTTDEAAQTTTAATETTPEASDGQAGEQGAPAKPAGVVGKDGKTVLPYSALKGAREQARRERAGREEAEARARALEQQIADLKAGKKPDQDGTEMTPEQEDELVTDFPALKPILARNRALAAEINELKKGRPAAAKEESADTSADDLQEAIDSVPLLAEWQTDPAHADKWARAVAIDASLIGSPKWGSKPQAERLAEVAKRVAEEFDLPAGDDTQTTRETTPPKGKARTDPAKAITEAARTAPNTLSDFKGGNPDKTSHESIARLPPSRLLARFDEMDDDAINEALRKSGGG